MISIVKKTFWLSATYVCGDILVKGIGFLLLPLYTAYLTPDAYGIIGVASVVTSVSVAFLSLGLSVAAFKFYYDLELDQRRRFYGTLWIFLLVVPAAVLISIELLGRDPLDHFLKQVPYSPYLRIALWTSYFSIAFLTLSRELLKAAERASTYVLLNLLQSILVIGLAVWFVVWLKKGATGALLAQLAGAVVTSLVSVLILRKYVSFAFDPILLKSALLLGIPIVPHFLAQWVLAASDRIVLERYVPLSEVGVYSVGYLLGSVMMIFIVACNNAMLPLFGRAKPSDDSQTRALAMMTTYYVLVMSFVGLCIILFSQEVIHSLLPVSYHQAKDIVPWVVLGYFFMGLYCIPMDVVVQIVGNSKPVFLYTTIAAVTNLGLNLLLIPRFGMKAAAITTAISYLVLFLGMVSFSHRKYPLTYEYVRIFKVIFVAILIFVISWTFSPNGTWAGIAFKFLWLVCFPLMLWFAGFMNEGEYGVIKSFIKKRSEAKVESGA